MKTLRNEHVAAASRRRTRVLKFICAGGIGFVVDAAILLALTRLANWQPVPARVISFLGAVTVTWWINRHFAYDDRRAREFSTALIEYWRYLVSQSMGALINLGIFAAALRLQPAWKAQPIWALAIASTCALFFNYYVMGRFVFTHRPASS